MNHFDDENNIIKHFQQISDKEVYFFDMNSEAESIYKSIHVFSEWENWTDNSGKADPPPDFFYVEAALMMDVMRVDDHSFISEKGKVVNPTNARESQLRKELMGSGILDLCPNVKSIINPDTGLPAKDDHNYSFYCDCYKRVINEHAKKIDLYKKNHPGYKTIFFVMDESSAYIQLCSKEEELFEGKRVKARPHLFFCDRTFVDTIKNLNIDYLIWYAPFKLLRTDERIVDLPKAVIYDVNKMADFDVIDYDPTSLVSSEL